MPVPTTLTEWLWLALAGLFIFSSKMLWTTWDDLRGRVKTLEERVDALEAIDLKLDAIARKLGI